MDIFMTVKGINDYNHEAISRAMEVALGSNKPAQVIRDATSSQLLHQLRPSIMLAT